MNAVISKIKLMDLLILASFKYFSMRLLFSNDMGSSVLRSFEGMC